MQRKIEQYVSKWDMLKKEDKVITGVSGGADSICLLFVLLELQKKIPFELVVVHVNHGLRGEDADGDEAYVKELCKEHGIVCEIYSENVELIAKNRKQSTEEAGRYVRREAFQKAMQTHGGTKIALAHHKNDSVETFFMNLARGTGLKGLGGIRPVVGEYIRPLLCLERKEIETYLEERKISYREDESNASDDYTRNRIRNHIIPYMEQEVNVKTVSHIADTMTRLQEIQTYLEEQTKECFEMCVKEEKNGYIVLEEYFSKVPLVLKSLVLKEVLVRISGKEKDLEEIHLSDLQALLEKQVGRRVDLPYEIEAKRVYEGLRLYKKDLDTREMFCVEVDFTDGAFKEYQWGTKRITCQLVKNGLKEAISVEKNDTKRFDYDIISDKVCIRTRQPGDYITIHSDGRTQKLKSFFINEKIPEEIRDEILLVADGHHILWIVGMRTNCMYHVSEHTKQILEINIDEGENHGREY
jgi:tRNA(Ile)-lysidine synthase